MAARGCIWGAIGAVALCVTSCFGMIAYASHQNAKHDAEDAAVQAQKDAIAAETQAKADAAFRALSPDEHMALARKALDARDFLAFTKNLVAIPPGMPGRQSLVDEKAKIDKSDAEKAWQSKVIERKNFADDLDKSYLNHGVDATVTTSGRYADTLHIKWALANRVAANELGKSGNVVSQARALGFQRVELTDGYTSVTNNTFTWDLTKPE